MSTSRGLSSAPAGPLIVRARAEQRERLACPARLCLGTLGAAERLERGGQHPPGFRRLVGRRARGEQVGGVLGSLPCRVVLARRRQHVRAHQTAAPAHVRRGEPRRLALDPIGRRGRAVRIAGLRASAREQLERGKAVENALRAHAPQDAVGRVRRRRRVAAREVQLAERQDRLWQRQRRLEQRPRLGRVPLPHAQPAKPDRRRPREPGARRAQILHRAHKLLLGRPPVTRGRQHLAVRRAADAEEMPRLPDRRPRVQSATPLRRAREVADVRARRDRVAQRPPRRGRLRELLADRQRRALIEPAQPLVDRARRDQRTPEQRQGDHLDADVLDTASKLQRLGAPSARRSPDPTSASNAMSASSSVM